MALPELQRMVRQAHGHIGWRQLARRSQIDQLQSSAVLGVTPAGASVTQVEAAWKELLKGSGISPAAVHPVLWNWSRNNFKPAV